MEAFSCFMSTSFNPREKRSLGAIFCLVLFRFSMILPEYTVLMLTACAMEGRGGGRENTNESLKPRDNLQELVASPLHINVIVRLCGPQSLMVIPSHQQWSTLDQSRGVRANKAITRAKRRKNNLRADSDVNADESSKGKERHVVTARCHFPLSRLSVARVHPPTDQDPRFEAESVFVVNASV